MSDLSKLGVLLHKTHIKVLLVLRYQGSTCVDPYDKITHQMWHDHPFSQINKTTERAVGGGLRQERMGDGWLDKI